MGFTANVRKALPGLFTSAQPRDTVDFASQWEMVVNSYLTTFSEAGLYDPLSVAAVYRARQMNASTVAALPLLQKGGEPLPQPNASQSWTAFITELILAMEDNGDGYVSIGADASMSVLPDRDVEAKWNVGETQRLYYRPGDGVQYRDDPTSQFRNLAVVPMNRGAGDLTGYGPMESPRIKDVIVAQQYASQYFANSGQPTGTLKVPAPLTEGEAAKLQQMWIDARSVRSPAVLSGGMDWTGTSFNMTDSQWVEGHSVDIGDVANLFGVPAHFLSYSPAGGSLTYTNRESLYRDYWLQTLWPLYGVPILEMVGDVLQIPTDGLAFDTESLFLAGLAERAQAAATLVGAGYDPAAVADVVGLPPIQSVTPVEVNRGNP